MNRSPLSRDQHREMWHDLAAEVLGEVRAATPEVDDDRIGYVTVQIERGLWLRARDALPPPFLDLPTEDTP